jgi:hypothetical protein
MIREAEARGMEMAADDAENWCEEVSGKEAALYLRALAAQHRAKGAEG